MDDRINWRWIPEWGDSLWPLPRAQASVCTGMKKVPPVALVSSQNPAGLGSFCLYPVCLFWHRKPWPLGLPHRLNFNTHTALHTSCSVSISSPCPASETFAPCFLKHTVCYCHNPLYSQLLHNFYSELLTLTKTWFSLKDTASSQAVANFSSTALIPFDL